ncbi:MAG: DUF6786 family protein [Phycisphaerae bacterium]
MSKTQYSLLIDLRKNTSIFFNLGNAQVTVCPDMGGRVFAELEGISLHRIDLDTVKNPDRPFNNYGGGNLWPAPEGGKFGFNYRGDQWYVQPAINNQPFQVIDKQSDTATIRKTVKLTNRLGTVVEAVVTRAISVGSQIPVILQNCGLKGLVSYQTVDSFEVINQISVDQALLAAWTLEQFQATDDTLSFVVVANPRTAINFDFYPLPGPTIVYHAQGFTYKTDGRCRGQIGIKKEALASLIGFYDLSQNLICLRQKINPDDDLFFNIADNDQPQGPYCAADNYSIFNSDPDMQAFELETIGGAKIEKGIIKGSELISRTTLAVFERRQDLEEFVLSLLEKRTN